MARPRDEKLKADIRAAKDAGLSIMALMEKFNLSRNTIFYHLKEEGTDKREHYTEEERKKIAAMSDAELEEYAQSKGKTFLALQRVAYRTRKRSNGAAEEQAKTKIELRGWVNFGLQSELLLVGLDSDMVNLANRRLAAYRLRLAPPNRLETQDGKKYCIMKLAFQKAIVTDTIKTLTENAAKIKTAWREV